MSSPNESPTPDLTDMLSDIFGYDLDDDAPHLPPAGIDIPPDISEKIMEVQL